MVDWHYLPMDVRLDNNLSYDCVQYVSTARELD